MQINYGSSDNKLIAAIAAVSVYLAACGTSNGDGSSGGTDGEPIPAPDCEGIRCDADDVSGWKISCLGDISLARNGVPVLDLNDVFLDDIYPGNTPCCEGCANSFDSHEACVTRCELALCAQAEIEHASLIDIANCYDPESDTNHCEFDMESCLNSASSEQTIAYNSGFSTTYTLDRVCAIDVDVTQYGNNGCFDWQCNGGALPSPAEECFGGPPDSNLGFNPPLHHGVSTPGSENTAELSWTYGYLAQDSEEAVSQSALSYSVAACTESNAGCFTLSSLEVSVPDGEYGGIHVRDARLEVIEVVDAPPMDGQSFTLLPNTIQVILSAQADGVPVSLIGWNTSTVIGTMSPHTGAWSLGNMTFDYQDTLLSASLRVDTHGTYANRAPSAAILIADEPHECDEMVTFHASSTDPDYDTMTHVWTTTIPGAEAGSGSTFSTVIPNGRYRIGLTSTDSSASMSTTAVDIFRTCQ